MAWRSALQDEGVGSFVKSRNELLDVIAAKTEVLKKTSEVPIRPKVRQ